MSRIFEKEKLKIKKEDDRRIKLTQEDKIRIKKIYEQGLYSQRELAEMYGVSRRTIQFAVNPESYKKNAENHKILAQDGRYYNKEKHREYTANYRAYKQTLYEEGKLV